MSLCWAKLSSQFRAIVKRNWTRTRQLFEPRGIQGPSDTVFGAGRRLRLGMQYKVEASGGLRRAAALLCAVALVITPLLARTKKGDKYLKEGEKAEARKDFDAALTYYDEAVEEDSREPAYMLADQRTRS